MSKSSMYMFHLASPYVPFKPANMLPYMYGLPCISFSVILFESNLPISRHSVQFSSVQSLSHVQLFATPWTAARQGTLSITNSQSLLRLMSTESVMPLNHLILCHPLLLLPSIFPALGSFQKSQFFASGGQSIGVSVSTSVLPMNIQEISPRNFAAQGTLKSLLQHHNSKASILQHSAFFIVQLTHSYKLLENHSLD